MEIKKISDELERIVESKRIPNALIFETDGLNSELEMSLEFAKKILLSNEQNPVNQNKIVKDLHSLSYPDLHIVFPIPISNNKKKDLYDYHYKTWSEMALKNNMRVSLSKWKETISYGNKQPIINIDSVRSVIKKLAVSSFHSNFRIIIFWMADKMNEEASNMLLKTIEEPGHETVFILLTEDIRKLLPTIVSRCQVIGSGGINIKRTGALENNEFEKGNFVLPSLFGNVQPDHVLAQEEIFGPVQVLIPFKDEEEAIRIANGTKFGLVAGIWTKDGSRQMRMAKQLKAGQVFINNYGAGGGVELPFGGVGHSGFGREKGFEALKGFSVIKTVAVSHG